MDIPVRILPPVNEPDKPMRVLQPRSVIERRKRRRLLHQQRLEKQRASERTHCYGISITRGVDPFGCDSPRGGTTNDATDATASDCGEGV